MAEEHIVFNNSPHQNLYHQNQCFSQNTRQHNEASTNPQTFCKTARKCILKSNYCLQQWQNVYSKP